MRVRLRPFLYQDAPAVARLANDSRVDRFLRHDFPKPYETAHALSYCEVCELNEQDGFSLQRVIEADGEVAGLIGVEFAQKPEDCSAEIGYWLGVPFWNQGIMTDALIMWTDYVFAEYEWIQRLVCQILPGNVASERVASKAGYYKEAVLRDSLCKKGEVMDILLYVRLRRDWRCKEALA